MRRVAAFDFDGTLTRRDTFVPFLRFLRGAGRLLVTATAEAVPVARVAAGRGDRDALKAAFVARLLTGFPEDAYLAAGESFAARVDARRLRVDTLARLAQHRHDGHEIVIVSASLDVYLRHVSARLGADHVISTRLEVAGGHLTGRLLGPNVRGPEKARLLRAWLGGTPVELWAYGDSSGDRDLLDMADHAEWVG